MIIDFTPIQKHIPKYVKEFLDNKTIDIINKDNVYKLKELMRDMITDIYIEADIRKLNKAVISAPEVNKCGRKGLEIKGLITNGSTGKIYKTSNSKRIVKIIDIEYPKYVFSDANNDSVLKKIEAEFKYTRIAGELGIGPRVHDTYYCMANNKYYAIIYMDVVPGITIEEFIKKYRSSFDTDPTLKIKIQNMIHKKVDLLHKNKIIHNDVWGANVMISGTPKKLGEVYIIDYGRSENIGPDPAHIKNKISLENHYIDSMFIFSYVKEVNESDVVQYVIGRLIDEGHLEIA